MASSALAVVGAADVVVRVGKELYRFLGEILDAPEEVRRLRNYIQEIDGLVESVKLFWEEQKALSPRQAKLSKSLSCASSQLGGVLHTLSDELSHLADIAIKHDGVTKPCGRIKWVFERKIAQSLQTIERSKLSLVATLVLLERSLSP